MLVPPTDKLSPKIVQAFRLFNGPTATSDVDVAYCMGMVPGAAVGPAWCHWWVAQADSVAVHLPSFLQLFG
jgi:hypothetical protein